jgi:hypothetical protein
MSDRISRFSIVLYPCMLAQHVYSSNMTKRHVRENGLSTVRAVLHGYAGDKGDTRGIIIYT